ncbi:Gastrokine-3, partial [Eschrichtius robustus]|nr:Gastrokine-3 [Eschrichtius robustus]
MPFEALKHYPSTRGLTYAVLPSRVKNLAQYGVPIKDVCRQVPTYFAQEQKEVAWTPAPESSVMACELLSTDSSDAHRAFPSGLLSFSCS